MKWWDVSAMKRAALGMSGGLVLWLVSVVLLVMSRHDTRVSINLCALVAAATLPAYLLLPHRIITNSAKRSSWKCLALQLALTLTLCLGVYLWLASTYSLWCCIQEYDRHTLCHTLLHLTSILDHANIPYFLCFGAVLSIYRGGLLPHEHDLDVCVMESHVERLGEFLATAQRQHPAVFHYTAEHHYRPRRVLAYRQEKQEVSCRTD